MSADNTANWVNRDLFEAIKKGDVMALADAGHMKYDDAEYITSYFESYENYHGKDPVEDEDEKYSKLVRRASTREFNKAIGSGNISRMAYAVGHSRDSNLDIGSWNEYEVFKDLFRQEPQYTDFQNNICQLLIFSNCIPPTGRGKSSTMYTISEMALTVHPNLDVRSNNPSDEYGDIPEQWVDLKKWIRSDGWNLLLIDEAKQFLMYADQSAGKDISKMLALLRHNKTHVVFIGHTGAGIPKDMRRQLFVLNKLSQKKAELGYGITPMTGEDRYEVSNVLYEFDDIPHTNVSYKSQGEEAIEIKFDKEEPDESDSIESNPTPDENKIGFPDAIESKTEKIKYMKTVLGMTQENIADYFGMEQGGISYHLNK